MENITSRKNAYIRHLRLLAADGAYRRECGEYLCVGAKLLREARDYGARVSSVLWKERESEAGGPVEAAQYTAPAELFDYACFEKNSPGPLFTVKMPQSRWEDGFSRVIVLDGVQDPGNVGTVVRTANAFGMDAVILTGDCADLYNTKTVRATMGAIFRQRVLCMSYDRLEALGLRIYGAALSRRAEDIRGVDLKNAAVAIGSEGRGLSGELLELCAGEVLIPMQPDSESLNAAVAAAVAMWEMVR